MLNMARPLNHSNNQYAPFVSETIDAEHSVIKLDKSVAVTQFEAEVFLTFVTASSSENAG